MFLIVDLLETRMVTPVFLILESESYVTLEQSPASWCKYLPERPSLVLMIQEEWSEDP